MADTEIPKDQPIEVLQDDVNAADGATQDGPAETEASEELREWRGKAIRGRPHFRISAHHGMRPGGPLSRDIKSEMAEMQEGSVDAKSDAAEEGAHDRIESQGEHFHNLNRDDLASVATRGRPHFRISAHHGMRPGGPLSRDIKSEAAAIEEGGDNQIDSKSDPTDAEEGAQGRVDEEVATPSSEELTQTLNVCGLRTRGQTVRGRPNFRISANPRMRCGGRDVRWKATVREDVVDNPIDAKGELALADAEDGESHDQIGDGEEAQAHTTTEACDVSRVGLESRAIRGRPHFRISAHHGMRPGGPLARDLKSEMAEREEALDNPIDTTDVKSELTDEKQGVSGDGDEVENVTSKTSDLSGLGSRLATSRGRPHFRISAHHGMRHGGALAKEVTSESAPTEEGVGDAVDTEGKETSKVE